MYLAHHHYSTASKNKLEDEFFNYLKSIDRTLIEDDKVEDFKAEILKKYEELCIENPRCKPIDKLFYNGHLDKKLDFHLLGSNASFTLLKSK